MTPEQIARECVEGLYTVEDHTSAGDGWHVVGPHGRVDKCRTEEIADRVAWRWRQPFYQAVLAAIERFASETPVPGPVGAERLDYVRAFVPKLRESFVGGQSELADMLDSLFAQIDHLTRCLRDCGEDGTAAIWSAGYDAGCARRAEFEAEMERLRGRIANLKLMYDAP